MNKGSMLGLAMLGTSLVMAPSVAVSDDELHTALTKLHEADRTRVDVQEAKLKALAARDEAGYCEAAKQGVRMAEQVKAAWTELAAMGHQTVPEEVVARLVEIQKEDLASCSDPSRTDCRKAIEMDEAMRESAQKADNRLKGSKGYCRHTNDMLRAMRGMDYHGGRCIAVMERENVAQGNVERMKKALQVGGEKYAKLLGIVEAEGCEVEEDG